MDPAMGIVGALLVARWSWGLIRTTGGILLDRQGPDRLIRRVEEAWGRDPAIEVHDLHIWSIGPGIYNLSAVVSVPTHWSASELRALIPSELGVVHSTIEVHHPESIPD